MSLYVNVSAYKFINLSNLESLRGELLRKSMALDLKGTILLSEEGMNLFVSGLEADVSSFKDFLTRELNLGDFPFKDSPSLHKPFRRMLVRIKKEIISMGCPDIKPAAMPAPRLTAEEFKSWLDNQKECIILDTRNDYEVRLGTFKNAMDLNIKTFRAFPDAIKALPESFKEKTIVTFCTGGIRCEKAAPLMIKNGFKAVYQLDGGILKYFETCGGEHYDKECFVFDRRVAVDATLQETKTTQCYECRSPLTPEEQETPEYVIGKSCPYCIQHTIAGPGEINQVT